jgi:hypothetical protein
LKVSGATSQEFFDGLLQYIDSKSKKRDKEKNTDELKAMEYWPLIKVVKIFVKSPILESGLVLVDLVSYYPKAPAGPCAFLIHNTARNPRLQR